MEKPYYDGHGNRVGGEIGEETDFRGRPMIDIAIPADRCNLSKNRRFSVNSEHV